MKIDSSAEDVEYYETREDEAVYSLEDYGEYTGNKLQNCLAQLPFPKVGVDEEFFGIYDVKFTARIYENIDATSFTQIDNHETTLEFYPPVYSDADLVEEIYEEENVHTIEFINEEFYFGMDEIDSTWQGEGIQSIVGTIFVKPGAESEGKVEIYMNTTIPADYGDLMADFVIMNYISFQDANNSTADPAKLVCTTTVG